MLKKLEIRALRGATTPFCLDFENGKKITIVYGENGSGKSTICDAVELLANGKLRSLEGKGLGKTESFWHSAGRRPADVAVTLTTTQGAWTATLARSKATVTPTANRPRAAVLRRSQLLELIAQPPASRFDAIRPFLEIEAVEQSEANLKKLIDQEKASSKTAIARIDENRVAVENFWQDAGSPGASALTWARSELRGDTTDLRVELERLDNFATRVEAAVQERERLAESGREQQSTTDALRLSQAQVEQEQARLAGSAGELVGVLEAADDYFHRYPNADICPLCGSSQFAADLPERVDTQLRSIRTLTDALKQRDSAERSQASARTIVERQQEAFVSAAVRLAREVTDCPRLVDADYPSLLRKVAGRLLTCSDADMPSAALSLTGQASEFDRRVTSARDQRRKQLANSQMLRRAVETYDSNYQTQSELESLIPRLEAALAEMQDERRRFVDDILTRVADRVGELYEAIHPGEGLSKISLALHPDRRASLEILGRFMGTEDVPPGAYFSESHLDTLGLCMWLALAEMENPRDTILVLDDVIASVDEPHVERAVELLYTLAQTFQHCIYTTHYRPWAEKYRWGWLKSGQCQFLELLPWGQGLGIRQVKSVPPIEELRRILTAQQPSVQLACASSGVMLEAILDFLTQLYECPVPRRKGKLTSGDYLLGVNNRLRAALRIERAEPAADGNLAYSSHPLGPILAELHSIAQLRNVCGCHFNELAFHLPPEDGLRFSRRVLDLADLLIDVDSGWPQSDKSGSYWANSAQTRRLHPLRQPG